jgi:hypothetical protein
MPFWLGDLFLGIGHLLQDVVSSIAGLDDDVKGGFTPSLVFG